MSTTSTTQRSKAQADAQALIQSTLAGLGYGLVAVEFVTLRDAKLRIWIENLDGRSVSLDDCAKASRGLDEPLDQCPGIAAIFPNSYQLELSSPGATRPLVNPGDYERFRDQRVRLHTFRPLGGSELANPEFALKFPKQKNFVGKLKGLRDGAGVLLEAEIGPKRAMEVCVPLAMISKANLEPSWDDLDPKASAK